MVWKNWIGKKVFIRLKTQHEYSGVVQDVDDDGNGMVLFSILDKFNKLVSFAGSEVQEMREESY